MAFAFVLLSACANTSTRPDDTFEPSPDVTVITDAGVDASADDAPNLDASSPDAAPDASRAPDAFSPDAFILPTEVCNGTDDDFDTAIDEGGTAQCQLAPRTEVAVCEAGQCLCRAPGTLAGMGGYADCNAAFADGCETALGTNENCGACGDRCDVASDCHLRGGVFACSPADIVDFSIARTGGQIACIVRADQRVVCRGPNTDFAISEAASETATLDWTVVDMPPAVEVRARQRTRASGVEGLSICVLQADRLQIWCRGDNTTGLLGFADRDPRRGSFLVPMFGAVARMDDWSTWSRAGAFYLRDNQSGYWAGDGRLSTSSYGTNQVLLSHGVADEALPGVGFFPPTGPLEAVWNGVARDFSCAQDVCCIFDYRDDAAMGRFVPHVGCWGRRMRGVMEMTEIPGAPDVSYESASVMPHILELAVTAEGRVEACLRARGTRFVCADATTAADSLGSASSDAFDDVPTRIFATRTPEGRADWQAMCLRHRPDWWQCWGTHEGWGAP